MSVTRYPAAAVRRQIEVVLHAWGMPEHHIAITADAMVETDLMGIDSHGISMLILYDQMQRAGQLQLGTEPTIVRQTASTALMDGSAGLGHPVAVAAMQLAIDKALAHDVGIVTVFNSHHFGACGYYAQMAARKNLIAFISTTSRIVTVTPTRGSARVLGANPLCFAIPTGNGPPIMVDISTSVVAANKVKVYAFNGKDIVSGWVIDADGRPLTDSAVAYDLLFNCKTGGLSPIGGPGMDLGGHKGYGLGIVAQVLSSSLSGGSFSPVRNRTQKPSDPDNIGHFFMALNPQAFRPFEDFQRDVGEMVEVLRATPSILPDEPVLVPGDPEWTSRRERLENGIPLPNSLVETIRDIAKSSGAEIAL